MKYIKISIVILLVSFISIFAYKLTTNNSNNKLSLTKEQMKEMLSYTIDGNKTSSMPTKGSGYKVKSITCKSGSILSWDNDNWLLEVEKVESEDLCNIDFTKNETLYNVKLIPTISKSFDSTSKTTTKNGTTTFYTNLKIKNITGCDSEILKGKVVVKNVTSNTTCNVEITKNIYNMLLINNPIIKIRTNFTEMYTDINTNTIFKAQEDNTDVYYFSGRPQNNWVKFGTFPKDVIVYRGYNTGYAYLPFREYDTLEECKNGSDDYNNNCTMHKYASAGDPMYWRIIRTNNDKSIRLLYAGTRADSTEGMIGVSAYNNLGYKPDPMYVGYMYGTSGSLDNNRTNENSSDIKLYIDKWYKNNMLNYTKYLSAEAVYCNERSLASGQIYSLNSNFNFEPHDRLLNELAPTYNCKDVRDKFTVSTETGNGDLTYPIALMTSDEVVYGGGVYSKYSNDVIPWYSSNSLDKDIIEEFFTENDRAVAHPNPYLLTAVDYYNKSSGIATLENSSKRSGILRAGLNYIPNAVRPVISLNGENLWKSGDGSASNPYEIVLN